MAITGVKHLRTTVAGRVPAASQVEEGEIAINLADRKLFTKYGSEVIEVGGIGVPTFKVVTNDVTGKAGEGYLFNLENSDGALVFKFPVGVAGKGHTVHVGDYNGTATLANAIVLQTQNNQKTHGEKQDIIITRPTRSVWQYIDDTIGWYCVDGIGEGDTDLPYEKVIILADKGSPYAAGVYNLPAGYEWSDFECVEFVQGHTGIDVTGGSAKLLSETIAATGGKWIALPSYDAAFTYVYAGTNSSHAGNINTQCYIDGIRSGYGVRMIIGYTKYKPVLASRPKGRTLLWSSEPVGTATAGLTESLRTFDAVMFVAEIVTTGSGYGNAMGKHTKLMYVDDLFESKHSSHKNLIHVGDPVGVHTIMANKVSDKSISFATSASHYGGGLTKIYGIRY